MNPWDELDAVTCPRCETDWPFPPPEDRCDCGYTFQVELPEDPSWPWDSALRS